MLVSVVGAQRDGGLLRVERFIQERFIIGEGRVGIQGMIEGAGGEHMRNTLQGGAASYVPRLHTVDSVTPITVIMVATTLVLCGAVAVIIVEISHGSPLHVMSNLVGDEKLPRRVRRCATDDIGTNQR